MLWLTEGSANHPPRSSHFTSVGRNSKRNDSMCCESLTIGMALKVLSSLNILGSARESVRHPGFIGFQRLGTVGFTGFDSMAK